MGDETLFFTHWLYLVYIMFCSSMYAEIRNPVPETDVLLQRGTEVLWFVSDATLLVLSESWNSCGICPLYYRFLFF